MIGAFIQLNEASPLGRARPVGYVVTESGCWEWVGSFRGNGYGYIWTEAGSQFAHRYVFSLTRTLTPGLTLDHLCRNRRCVRPDHLEEVTNAENLRRGRSPSAENARKTACHRGHPLSGNNLISTRAGRGRECAACERIWRANAAARSR